ncbi:hypothetical protein AB0C07_11790 [Actinoplanes missouriensis]|uniref:hypothetical protein n=1 Tax=Actinoplanes missouriensis TaxID=1866 RepID=UPI0033F87542
MLLAGGASKKIAAIRIGDRVLATAPLPGKIHDAARDRNAIAQRKDPWTNTFGTVADKRRAKSITVDESSLSPKHIDQLLADAKGTGLSLTDLKNLDTVARQWNALALNLRRARSPPVDDGLPGTSGTIDRVLFDERSGQLILIEEKGAGSGLGSRKDATLRNKIQAVLEGDGPDQIQYLRVTTSPAGVVTTVRYLIDDATPGRGVIKVAGTP